MTAGGTNDGNPKRGRRPASVGPLRNHIPRGNAERPQTPTPRRRPAGQWRPRPPAAAPFGPVGIWPRHPDPRGNQCARARVRVLAAFRNGPPRRGRPKNPLFRRFGRDCGKTGIIYRPHPLRQCPCARGDAGRRRPAAHGPDTEKRPRHRGKQRDSV